MVRLVASRPRPASAKPQVRFRLRITCADVIAIGPGKVALLEAIREHGSLSSAALHLGMSYRRAWVLVDETNRSLREPAVAAAVGGANGGGSVLTSTGDAVVKLYRTIEARAEAACADELKALVGLLAKPATARKRAAG